MAEGCCCPGRRDLDAETTTVGRGKCWLQMLGLKGNQARPIVESRRLQDM